MPLHHPVAIVLPCHCIVPCYCVPSRTVHGLTDVFTQEQPDGAEDLTTANDSATHTRDLPDTPEVSQAEDNPSEETPGNPNSEKEPQDDPTEETPGNPNEETPGNPNVEKEGDRSVKDGEDSVSSGVPGPVTPKRSDSFSFTKGVPRRVVPLDQVHCPLRWEWWTVLSNMP